MPPNSSAAPSGCWRHLFFAPVTAIFLVFGLSRVFEKSAGAGSHQSSSGRSWWKLACVIGTAVTSSAVALRVHTGTTGRLSSATK